MKVGDSPGDAREEAQAVPDASQSIPRVDRRSLYQQASLVLAAVSLLLVGASVAPAVTVEDLIGAEEKLSDATGGLAPVSDIDRFGEAVAILGDLDGPGGSELTVAVGSPWPPGAPPPPGVSGALWILQLDQNFDVVSETLTTTATIGESNFGNDVEVLGDLDGPGGSALAIAVSDSGRDDGAATNAGGFWILFLDTNGAIITSQLIDATSGGFVGPIHQGDEFGNAFAFLGDLDGPGGLGPALAVSSSQDDDEGPNRGSVWILFLNPDGTVQAEQKIDGAHGGFSGSIQDGEIFGTSLAAIDPNSDGFPELAVGVQGVSTADARVYVLFLQSDGTVSSDVVIHASQVGSSTGGVFANSLANLGDYDGDGFGDLFVGAPRQNQDKGVLFFLYLNADGSLRCFDRVDSSSGGFVGPVEGHIAWGADVAMNVTVGSATYQRLLMAGAPEDDGAGAPSSAHGAVWFLELLPPDPICCGDSKLGATEQCDDGNLTPGDGCDEACNVEVYTCCDDSTTTCNSDAACGGGTCCLGRCDSDGDAGNGCDGTGAACSSGATSECTGAAPACCGPVCGNGFVEPGEACDDGNLVSGDGCSGVCEPEGICADGAGSCGGDGDCTGGRVCLGGICTEGYCADEGDCSSGTCCGNGVITSPEECDDGNLIDDDACDNSCTACASCPPACLGFEGPSAIQATVKKTSLKDTDNDLDIDKWATKGQFLLGSEQVQQFSPATQPVQVRLRESDGASGFNELWVDAPLITPGECLPEPSCFEVNGKPNKIKWKYKDGQELLNPGFKTGLFKQKFNDFTFKFVGKLASIGEPMNNLGTPELPMYRVREDVIVGGICSSVLMDCVQKGASYKCVPAVAP